MHIDFSDTMGLKYSSRHQLHWSRCHLGGRLVCAQDTMYYFGCTSVPPEKYDMWVRFLLCGLLSNYFEQSCLLLVYKVMKWSFALQPNVILCAHCSMETGWEFLKLWRTIGGLLRWRMGNSLWSERHFHCHQCRRRLLCTWISVSNAVNHAFLISLTYSLLTLRGPKLELPNLIQIPCAFPEVFDSEFSKSAAIFTKWLASRNCSWLVNKTTRMNVLTLVWGDGMIEATLHHAKLDEWTANRLRRWSGERWKVAWQVCRLSTTCTRCTWTQDFCQFIVRCCVIILSLKLVKLMRARRQLARELVGRDNTSEWTVLSRGG